jgi:hypothetical protein
MIGEGEEAAHRIIERDLYPEVIVERKMIKKIIIRIVK